MLQLRFISGKDITISRQPNNVVPKCNHQIRNYTEHIIQHISVWLIKLHLSARFRNIRFSLLSIKWVHLRLHQHICKHQVPAEPFTTRNKYGSPKSGECIKSLKKWNPASGIQSLQLQYKINFCKMLLIYWDFTNSSWHKQLEELSHLLQTLNSPVGTGLVVVLERIKKISGCNSPLSLSHVHLASTFVNDPHDSWMRDSRLYVQRF